MRKMDIDDHSLIDEHDVLELLSRVLWVAAVELQVNAVALHYRLRGEVDEREVDRRDCEGDQPRDDRDHDGIGGEDGEVLDLYEAEVGRYCDTHTDPQHAQHLEEDADAVSYAELCYVVCDQVEGFIGAAAVSLRVYCDLDIGAVVQES